MQLSTSLPEMFSLPRLSFDFSRIPFPSLSIPAGVQRQFFAFVLQRTLGHLVKPGQLDSRQIDAQIGNGFVEIKHVELDEQVRTRPVS